MREKISKLFRCVYISLRSPVFSLLEVWNMMVQTYLLHWNRWHRFEVCCFLYREDSKKKKKKKEKEWRRQLTTEGGSRWLYNLPLLALLSLYVCLTYSKKAEFWSSSCAISITVSRGSVVTGLWLCTFLFIARNNSKAAVAVPTLHWGAKYVDGCHGKQA